MNTKIRFLVLDRTNSPLSPAKQGLHLADVQNPASPSILSEDTAMKFAQLLAQRNVGQRYYVAKVIAVASAHDNLDARLDDGENTKRPVTLVATTADGTGDE